MNARRKPLTVVGAAQDGVSELALDSLIVDHRYQRPYNEDRSIKIAAEWNPVLCGVLDVADLGRGSYAVIDGQHRLGALRILEIDRWWCKVNALSEVDQAKAFVAFQQTVLRVHACDQHKAAVFARDPLALAVDALVQECGFYIAQGRGSGSLSCANSVREAYSKYGDESLRRALGIIARSWGLDDRTSRKAPIVVGMTLLVAKYPIDIDDDALAHKLSEVPSGKILRTATVRSEVGAKGTTAAVLVARTLLDVFNSGKRKKISPTRLGRGA